MDTLCSFHLKTSGCYKGALWTTSVHFRIENGKICWWNNSSVYPVSSVFLYLFGWHLAGVMKMNRGWNYFWLKNNTESIYTARYDRVHRPFTFCYVHQKPSLKNLLMASVRNFPQSLSVIPLTFYLFQYPSWEVKGWRVGFWEGGGVSGLPWWSVDRPLVPTAASRGLCIWIL